MLESGGLSSAQTSAMLYEEHGRRIPGQRRPERSAATCVVGTKACSAMASGS